MRNDTDEGSRQAPWSGLPAPSAGGPPRRRAVAAGLAVVAALIAVLALVALGAVTLTGRGRPTTPATSELSGAQPVVTVEPQPTPTAPPAPTPSATAIPIGLRQEIEDAYDRFWRVRADAALRLDVSHLPEVAAGTALDIETRNVEQLRAEGRAGRYVVDLRYGVIEASQTSALVAAKYQNRSYFIDARTKQPLAPTPAAAEEVKMTFKLEKIDGTWKVVEGVVDPA
jgi:hypothetical protein